MNLFHFLYDEKKNNNHNTKNVVDVIYIIQHCGFSKLMKSKESSNKEEREKTSVQLYQQIILRFLYFCKVF